MVYESRLFLLPPPLHFNFINVIVTVWKASFFIWYKISFISAVACFELSCNTHDKEDAITRCYHIDPNAHKPDESQSRVSLPDAPVRKCRYY